LLYEFYWVKTSSRNAERQKPVQFVEYCSRFILKKYLILLLTVFGFSSLGCNAFAAGEYFGVRLETLIPSAGTEFSVLYPLLGAEFGVEFDAGGTDVGIRASVTTLIVWFRLALDAYFVLPSNQYGSGAYFGLGGGLFAVPFAKANTNSFLPEIRGIIGYQSSLPTLGGRFFIELVPSVYFNNTSSVFMVSIGTGLTFR
jgi:hypothetical protein